MAIVDIFIDESGTVCHTPDDKCFYIISFLFVKRDISKVKTVFKKEKLKLAAKYPKLGRLLTENSEIKGKDVSENKKSDVYKSLCEKCPGLFEIGIIVIDLKNCSTRFIENTARMFNYLVKLFLIQKFCTSSSLYEGSAASLHLVIDERNVATESRRTLEDYLNTELCVGTNLFAGDITVEYSDSKNFHLLQLSDFLTNTVFRHYVKHIAESKSNIEMLKDFVCGGKFFVFPVHCFDLTSTDCIAPSKSMVSTS